MRCNYQLIATLMVVFFCFAVPGQSQEVEDPESHTAPVEEPTADHPGESGHHDHATEHPGLRNEIVVFLGATDEAGHPTEFTWGLEYIYEFAHRWGVGGFIDYAGGSLRNAVVGVPIVFNPGGRWYVTAAPGIEYHRGRGDSVDHHKADAHGETDETEKHFLVRLGAGYSFEIAEHYSVIPAVYLDFVKGEEVWVYGLNFAYKF